MKKTTTADHGDSRADESFLQRFNRRKNEHRVGLATQEEPIETASGQPDAAKVEEELPTDADMPPIESLTADSDYSGFFSPKVSQHLRQQALRKLFHSDVFNVIDELDEYIEDFTTFAPLGDIVTADMKHQIEMQARKQAEKLQQALNEEASGEETQESSTNNDSIVDDLQADENADDIQQVTEHAEER